MKTELSWSNEAAASRHVGARRLRSRSLLIGAAVLLAAGLFAAGLLVGGRDGDGGPAAPAPVTAHPITVGVWQPGAPKNMNALKSFEQAEGVHAGIVSWFQSWDNAQDGPDISLFKAVASHGSVPMLTWEPGSSLQPDAAPITLADIAAGRYDTFALKWARALAAYRKPVLLRWGHEMNGDWYPWGYQVNGNTPARYVAAWQHLHDLFASAGATNVQWVWCPNVVDSPSAPLEALYPGDAYVDWVGLDGYNRAQQGWLSFDAIFHASYARLTALTSKPVMIGEVGAGEAANDPAGLQKAAWIQTALTFDIPNEYPAVRAVIWFNESKVGVEKDGEDWRLGTPWERWAFARAVRRAPYTGRPPGT